MSRLRPYWVVGVVIAVTATIAIAVGINNPAFRVKKLTVTGLSRVAKSDVLAHAALDPAANVWFLNTRGMEARIESIPYVETATVHRVPLAEVTIAIEERTASACVRDTSGRDLTIDRENRVLDEVCSDPKLVAYTLRGPLDERAGTYVRDRELSELESDGGTLATKGPHFRAFSHDRYGELVAMMPSGISVQFGDGDDLQSKDRMIDPILAQLGPRATEVKSVDLRAPATPVVEYRAPAIRRRPQSVDTQ